MDQKYKGKEGRQALNQINMLISLAANLEPQTIKPSNNHKHNN